MCNVVGGWLIQEGDDLLTRPTRKRLRQPGGMQQRQPRKRRAALSEQISAGNLSRIH